MPRAIPFPSKNAGGTLLEETEDQLDKRNQRDLEQLEIEEKQRRVVGKNRQDVYRRRSTRISVDERPRKRQNLELQ